MRLLSNTLTKTLSKIAVVGGLLSSTVASQTINMPSNWPSDQITLGLADDGSLRAVLDDGNLHGLPNLYLYTYINSDATSFGKVRDILSKMRDEKPIYANGKGKVSFIMQMFADETNVDVLLANMNNVSLVNQIFQALQTLGQQMTSDGGTNPVVVLEPSTFSTILQARFHKEKEIYAGTQRPYSEILTFPAYVPNGSTLPGFDFLNGYPQTVQGLAQALVHATKQLLPNPVVASHMNTWAVYANGCAGGNGLESINTGIANGTVDVKARDGITTWNENDIKVSSFANISFLKELYGEIVNGQPAINQPDMLAVDKAMDAGFIAYSPYYAPTVIDATGRGTETFFWNQAEMDKWLVWNKMIAHEMRLPILGLRLPVGNGSLTNVPYSWQDTFADWLFNTNNWDGKATVGGKTFSWSQGNWEKFKQAGFIGLWVGRDGWPAAGTHPGLHDGNGTGNLGQAPVATAANERYPFLRTPTFLTYGSYISGSANLNGDGGAFIRNFATSDRSFSPIQVESFDFEGFSGFCTANETTVDVSLTGTQAFVTSKGTTVLGSGQNDSLFTANQFPEQLVDNTVIFYSGGSIFTPNTGRDELAGGVISTSNSALGSLAPDAQLAIDELSEIWVNIEIDVPNLGVVKDAASPVNLASAVNATFPVRYRFDIYDQMGQYVSGNQGVISEQDLLRISTNENGNLNTLLDMRILPTDAKGRQLGTGIYIFRGFIEEEAKLMCESPTDANGASILQLTLDQLANEEQCRAVGGNWLIRVRNAVVVKQNIPYAR